MQFYLLTLIWSLSDNKNTGKMFILIQKSPFLFWDSETILSIYIYIKKLGYLEIEVSVKRAIKTFCIEILKQAFWLLRRKTNPFVIWDCSGASTRQWTGFCGFFNGSQAAVLMYFLFRETKFPPLKLRLTDLPNMRVGLSPAPGLELRISPLLVPAAHYKPKTPAFLLLYSHKKNICSFYTPCGKTHQHLLGLRPQSAINYKPKLHGTTTCLLLTGAGAKM